MVEDEGGKGDRESVLICLCGCSPAVITETVWALYQETPALLVDRVVVITTGVGRQAIRRELFEGGVWDRLRMAMDAPEGKLIFGDSGDSIRLVPDASRSRELDDIASDADSVVAADFILETLRQFSENPNTRIVFSLAGGRKTMTALGALCMTLLGRPDDLLCHVLVNPPFDHPQLVPKFHFPDPDIAHFSTPAGGTYTSAQARITLCNIPFVRVRDLFQEKHLRLPGTFSKTVQLANHQFALENPPELTLVPGTCQAQIDQVDLALNPAEFTLLWMLAERCREGLPTICGQQQLVDTFSRFVHAIDLKAMPELLHHNRFKGKCNVDDMRKLTSSLNKKIRTRAGSILGIQALLPSRGKGKYGLGAKPELIDVK